MPLADRRPPRQGSSAASQHSGGASSASSGSASIRSYVLDVPFELRGFPGARWNAEAKAFVYDGEQLPEALSPFRSQPYSWERLKEDELNEIKPVASVPLAPVTLRPHQVEGAAKIRQAIEAGRTCFLNADDVGLGKTIETWQAVLDSLPDAETVLIVCPLSVIAHWRRTIANMGDGGKRIVVINYDRLKKLFEVPAHLAAKASRRRNKAVRKVRTQKGIARYGEAYGFDVLIWDESHKLRNLGTARSRMSFKINANAGFVAWLSATAGQNPLELAYLAPLLAQATGAKASDLNDFQAWCQDQGIGVAKGAFGKWNWRGYSDDPAERAAADEDLEKIRRLLFEGQVPAGIRRSPADIAGWPEINRILLPVALEGKDRRLYEEAWREFRQQLGLEHAGAADSKNGLVARLRFRQKASLLRTAATVDLANDLLEQGHQIAISVAFHETMDVITEALTNDGYQVSQIKGGMDPSEKENRRPDFQQGRTTICVYTVEEAISLHQGEYNNAVRSNIIHDLRWSALQTHQIEGRTHRDGNFSQIYWMLGEDTIEEDIAAIVLSRLRSMGRMLGDDATVGEIEKLLGRVAIT